MAQVFANRESVGVLTKTGNTTVRLSPSVITIGARQYVTGNLVCDTGISGAGGLDTGSVQARLKYYVYAVVDAGVAKLICSLSSSQPTGFSVFKFIDVFSTDENSNVEFVREFSRSQTKTLISGVTTFNNLEIGKKYSVNFVAKFSENGLQPSAITSSVNVDCNGVLIDTRGHTNDNYTGQSQFGNTQSGEKTFTAGATTLTATVSDSNCTLSALSYIQLKEISDSVETTIWD